MVHVYTKYTIMSIISTMQYVVLTISVESELSADDSSIIFIPLLIIDSAPYSVIAYLHATFIRAGTVGRKTNSSILTRNRRLWKK